MMGRYLSPDDLRELDSAGLRNLIRWRRGERDRAFVAWRAACDAHREARLEHDRRRDDRGDCPMTPKGKP